MTCRERLEKYFRENGVAFEARTHPVAYTAQEIAATLHVPGRQLAKVVMVTANGQLVMAVLPAPYRVDFPRLASVVGAKSARLAHEEDFQKIFPDCEVGAMPPFGNLYGVPTYIDQSLAEGSEIVFLAGTHGESMKVKVADYQRLAQPKVAEFATGP